MIECPECSYTGHKGMVEKTLYQRFGETLEPVAEWVACENCDGSGEIDVDQEEDAC
jgi:RecJ-like exonuclease